MNETVSVIVPVYKVEKYLSKCIDSILCQTYEHLEIILVDDGSPDNCGKICDEYSKKDIRIKVIHKKNGGVGTARNIGIDNANGKFIFFVDSDDYINEDAIDVLMKLQEQSNADLICASHEIIDRHGIKAITYEDKSLIREQFSDNLYYFYKILKAPWAKLFKTNIIKNNNIYFEKIPHSEDALFNMMYLKYCTSVKVISDIVYIYNRRSENSAIDKLYVDFALYRMKYFNSIVELEKNLNVDIEKVKELEIVADIIFKGTVLYYISAYPFKMPYLKKLSILYKQIKQYLPKQIQCKYPIRISRKAANYLSEDNFSKFVARVKYDNIMVCAKSYIYRLLLSLKIIKK